VRQNVHEGRHGHLDIIIRLPQETKK